MIERLKLKTLDWYIMKKYLGTFFFSLLLCIVVIVVFDFSEKIDDFIEKEAPLKAVIFDYYVNLIPYYSTMFTSLFTFIAVIYFSSKMAYNSEIIAILSSGISFRRLMYPYLLSALILALFSFGLKDGIIPSANRHRFKFEEQYLKKRAVQFNQRNVHKQIEKGLFMYMESYSNNTETGYKFALERFEDGKLLSKLTSESVKWNPQNGKWTIRNYTVRDFDGLEERLTSGRLLDTLLNMSPEEFKRSEHFVETMNIRELRAYMDELRMQGADNLNSYIIEYQNRLSFPFATFILTLIGVSLSTRKDRGGIGIQIGIGVGLSFAYILFQQFSAQFATKGSLSPMVAAWIPNIIFLAVGLLLYSKAQK